MVHAVPPRTAMQNGKFIRICPFLCALRCHIHLLMARWISSNYSVSINAADGLKIDVADGGKAKLTTFPSGNRKNGKLLDDNLQTYWGLCRQNFASDAPWDGCVLEKMEFFEKQCTNCWRHTPLRLSPSRYWCSSTIKPRVMLFLKLKIISYYQRTIFEWKWTKNATIAMNSHTYTHTPTHQRNIHLQHFN